jgi:hypothetical protein
MLKKTLRASSCIELSEIRNLDCLLQQCETNVVFISCDDLLVGKRNKIKTINVIRHGPDLTKTTQSFTEFLEEFLCKTQPRPTIEITTMDNQSLHSTPTKPSSEKTKTNTNNKLQTQSCSSLNLLADFCDVDESIDNVTDNNECETNFSCSENILNRQTRKSSNRNVRNRNTNTFIKNDNINRGYKKINYSNKLGGNGGNNSKPMNKKILKKLCSCQIYEKPDYISDKPFLVNCGDDDDPFSEMASSSSAKMKALSPLPQSSMIKTSFAQNNKVQKFVAKERDERSVNIIEVPTQEIIVEAIVRSEKDREKSLVKSLSRAKFSPFMLRKQSSRVGDDFTSETAKEAALLTLELDKKILEPFETVC